MNIVYRVFATLVASLMVVSCSNAAPAAVRRERVMILGDSIMVDGTPGVQAALEATGVTTVYPEAFPATGLSRSPWQTSYPRLVRELRPTAVVMMTSGWDFKTAAADPPSYAKDVRHAAQLLTAHGATLIWIGHLPGDERFTSEPVRTQINALTASGLAGLPRARYVSADPSFDGSDGRYAMFLPDRRGRLVRVRKIDGNHLCPAGAVRLGDVVFNALRGPLHLPNRAPGWRSGAWRSDDRYTKVRAFDARTLKLAPACPEIYQGG